MTYVTDFSPLQSAIGNIANAMIEGQRAKAMERQRADQLQFNTQKLGLEQQQLDAQRPLWQAEALGKRTAAEAMAVNMEQAKQSQLARTLLGTLQQVPTTDLAALEQARQPQETTPLSAAVNLLRENRLMPQGQVDISPQGVQALLANLLQGQATGVALQTPQTAVDTLRPAAIPGGSRPMNLLTSELGPIVDRFAATRGGGILNSATGEQVVPNDPDLMRSQSMNWLPAVIQYLGNMGVDATGLVEGVKQFGNSLGLFPNNAPTTIGPNAKGLSPRKAQVIQYLSKKYPNADGTWTKEQVAEAQAAVPGGQ